jgi:hypothetical protein
MRTVSNHGHFYLTSLPYHPSTQDLFVDTPENTEVLETLVISDQSILKD